MKDYKSLAVEIINKALDYSNQAMTYFDEEDIKEIAEELAEDHGFKSYGDSCVINVKGRPYSAMRFDVEDISKKLGTTVQDYDLNDAIEAAINIFVQDLELEYPDFVVEGRSGGYWGLSNFYWNIDISPLGRATLVKELENKYIELINKEDKSQEQIQEDLEEDMQYAYDYYTSEIFDKLLEDKMNFKINDDYMFAMVDIEKEIDKEEEKMANIDTWVNHFEANKYDLEDREE